MDSLIAANVKQRPLRTAVSIFGVSLGVILIVLTVGLARGMMRSTVERQANVDAELRFYPPGDIAFANPLMLPTRYRDAIVNGVTPTAEDPDLEPKPPIKNVAAATPVGEYVQSGVGGLGFELVDGIEYESFVRTTEMKILSGRPLGDGRTPGIPYEVMVDDYYAETNKDLDGKPVKVGSKIQVLGNEMTVVGIYGPPVLARVKIPLYTLQQLFGGADNCSFIMIRTTQPEVADQVKADLEKYYPGNRILKTSDLPALYSQGLTAVEIFLNVVIVLALIISTLVILLAMYTTIIERTREIGILKSLGASKTFIVLAIEKEAALISGLGVAVGFVIAVIGKYIIESGTRLQIDIQMKWLVFAAIIGLLSGIIGALYPAMRAANLDPIEALSYE